MADRKSPQPRRSGPPPRPPKPGRATGDARPQEPAKKPKGVRAAMSRTITRVPFLRRFYIRRMIRFIDKAHARNRPLPPDMVQLDQFLSQVPAKDRQSALEAAILADQEGTGPSRDMRRLAEKQARQSGRGGGRQRPGSPPRPRNAPRPR